MLLDKFVWKMSHGELRSRGPANKVLSLQIETRPLWKVRKQNATDATTKIPVITYLKESRGDSERRTFVGEQSSTPDGPGSMS